MVGDQSDKRLQSSAWLRIDAGNVAQTNHERTFVMACMVGLHEMFL